MKKILSISISGSPFYKDDLHIDFSNKLNCLMGGRGTGKTTLLYFLLSALDKNAESYKNVYSILKSNLGDGKITVEFEDDNKNKYKIFKTINDPAQVYNINNLPEVFNDETFVSFDVISDSINCDFYEAQAIEEIGRSGISRLQLLDKKIQEDVNLFKNQIQSIQIEAGANAHEIKNINLKIAQKQDLLRSFENIEEQFENHKKIKPIGLSEVERKEFETADENEKTRGAEKRYVDSAFSNVRGFSQTAEGFKQTIDDYLEKYITPVVNGGGKLTNRAEIYGIIKPISETLGELSVLQAKIVEQLKALTLSTENSIDLLDQKHEIQQAEFVKLKQKFESNKEFINTYNKLSKQLDDKKNAEIEIKDLISKQIILKTKRDTLISDLNRKKQEIFNKRLATAAKMNLSFNKSIVITLSYGGIKDEFESKLKDALRGSGLRYNELIPKIVQNYSPDQFAKIVHEKNVESLKLISGIDKIRGAQIIENLFETDFIYIIETLYTPDLPDFLLKVTDDKEILSENYRKSDILSMGQRCTAVLPIVFAVSENPLIIDQPEDNLDNKYITQNIHKIIKDQKESRQLIFITHNPNIPVLSDSEANVFLTYDNKSFIEKFGTIEDVKENIINLLEGGREAFKTRSEIYGN